MTMWDEPSPYSKGYEQGRVDGYQDGYSDGYADAMNAASADIEPPDPMDGPLPHD